MPVTKLAEFRAREMVAVLEELLQEAQGGRLLGFAFAIKVAAKQHRMGAMGDYETDPLEGVAAASRLHYRLNQLVDRSESGRPDFTRSKL